MARMKFEYTLFTVGGKNDPNGTKRMIRGTHDSLEGAHKQAILNGFSQQVTYEETIKSYDNPEPLPHAHIMEFRNDEHYNDIYLISPVS